MGNTIAINMTLFLRLPFNRHIGIAKRRLSKVVETVKGVIQMAGKGLGEVTWRLEYFEVGRVARDHSPEVLSDHFLTWKLVRFKDKWSSYFEAFAINSGILAIQWI